MYSTTLNIFPLQYSKNDFLLSIDTSSTSLKLPQTQGSTMGLTNQQVYFQPLSKNEKTRHGTNPLLPFHPNPIPRCCWESHKAWCFVSMKWISRAHSLSGTLFTCPLCNTRRIYEDPKINSLEIKTLEISSLEVHSLDSNSRESNSLEINLKTWRGK